MFFKMTFTMNDLHRWPTRVRLMTRGTSPGS